jgi:NAD+ kinase
VATVLLVVHERRKEALELAAQTAAWLTAAGHTVRLPARDAAAAGLPEHAAGTDSPDPAEGADLAVSLGGDGTMLRAVSLTARRGVPVFGVNVGNLGYLTAAEPSALPGALEDVLAGRCEIEERAMLAVTLDGGGPGRHHLALNEAVVEKPSPGHTVRLAVSINGTLVERYVADGLIVATPTGSTAYAFSARGPILSPGLRALQVTPVSPHMAFDRTLVLAAGDEVRIEVLDYRPASLSVDGRELGLVQPGQAVVAALAPQTARFATLGRRDFYAILKTKFGLGRR